MSTSGHSGILHACDKPKRPAGPGQITHAHGPSGAVVGWATPISTAAASFLPVRIHHARAINQSIKSRDACMV